MIKNSRMLKSSLPKNVQDSINRFQAIEKRFMELDDSKRDKFLTMMNVKDWEELEDKVMETSDTRFTNVLCEDMEDVIHKLENGKDIKSSHKKPIKSAHNFSVGDRVYVNQYREGKGHLWDSFGTVVDVIDDNTYSIKWDSGKVEILKKGSFYSVDELPEPLKSAYVKKLIKSDATDDFFPGKMGNDKPYFAMSFHVRPFGESATDNKVKKEAADELANYMLQSESVDIVDWNTTSNGLNTYVVKNNPLAIAQLISNIRTFEEQNNYKAWFFHFQTTDNPEARPVSIWSNSISNSEWEDNNIETIDNIIQKKFVKSSKNIREVTKDKLKHLNGNPLNVNYKGREGKVWYDGNKKICYDFGDGVEGTHYTSIGDVIEDLKTELESSRKITSARFTVTDKETGEVLGSADTYEEAVNQWGEEVLITDTQVAEEITSSKRLNMNKKETDYQFNKRIVNSVMTKDMTEEQAITQIASRHDVNTGFAKRIFNNIMKDERLISSGIMEIADEINKPFDLNGDLDSWFEDYVKGSGKSNTVGGELVRAAQRILYRYYNDGDMIGRGYGKETVNPAARYIIDKASDYSDVYEMEEMIDGDSEINRDDGTYSRWQDSFETTFADYLRDHEKLFHTPNKEDMWDWKTNDDYDSSVDEVYVEDYEGNRYYFRQEGGEWRCDSIDFNAEPDWYEGDVVDDSDEYFADEIYDKSDEYGDVEMDGFNYAWEAYDEADEEGEHHEWRITSVELLNPTAEVGDYWRTDEFESYDVFDTNGNEVREIDML